jgi:hypothetical protein
MTSFSSSVLIDDQLRPTLDSLISAYIQTWYSNISTDTEFLQLLSSLLSSILSRLEKKLQKVDFIQLLCLQLPVIIKQHLIDYSTSKEKLNTAYSGGRTLNQLFHGTQPHFALDSADRETEYLRNVSDTLLHKFLPYAELKSDILRFLLRELLSNVVLSNLVERLCNPDYIAFMIVEVRRLVYPTI